MSLLGDDVAIISLGLSCQAAHQIEVNAPLLRALTGDASLQPSALPWDYLLTPVSGLVESLIAPGEFPAREELSRRGPAPGKPWWRRRNILYWHAFASSGGYEDLDDIDGAYAGAREKFEHMAAKLPALRQRDRVIAVVTTTQYNLGGILAWSSTGAPFISPTELTTIHDLARDQLNAELLVVTCPDHHAGVAVPGVTIVERRYDPANEDWTGCSEAWREALQAALASDCDRAAGAIVNVAERELVRFGESRAA